MRAEMAAMQASLQQQLQEQMAAMMALLLLQQQPSAAEHTAPKAKPFSKTAKAKQPPTKDPPASKPKASDPPKPSVQQGGASSSSGQAAPAAPQQQPRHLRSHRSTWKRARTGICPLQPAYLPSSLAPRISPGCPSSSGCTPEKPCTCPEPENQADGQGGLHA